MENQLVFTVVWTTDFVFTMVKLIKIKKTFCQEFHRNHPYLSMSKKYFFWLISYVFPISMIKFKNRLFVKKSKNYLKCEFQYFWPHMLEKDALFSDSYRKLKYLTPPQSPNFLGLKIPWKFMNFSYQIPHTTKKVIKKRIFSESPLCNSKVIFWIFEKN